MLQVARFEFALFGINTYVVWDDDTFQCIIIDPGMSSVDERQSIDHFIDMKGLNVIGLVNTHLHIDHAIGNKYVRERYHVGLSANPADAELGRNLEVQAEIFGLPFSIRAEVPTISLSGGDVLRIGEGELAVLYVPGHTPGHIALYAAKEGFVIVGDVIFRGSIGRTDLPGGNHDQLMESIDSQLKSLPDSTIVYPGHGPETTIGREKKFNPFMRD